MSGTVRFVDIRTASQVAVVGLDEDSKPVVMEGVIPPNFLDRAVSAAPRSPFLTPEDDGEEWLRLWAENFRYFVVGIYEPPLTEEAQRKNPWHEKAGTQKDGENVGGDFAHKPGSAMDAESTIHEILQRGEITGVQPIPGFEHRTSVRFATIDGTPVLLKAHDGLEELTAIEVNKMMGNLVRIPPVALRSLEGFLPNSTAGSQVQLRSMGTRASRATDWAKRVNPELLRDAALFDVVIGLFDRHPDNWIVEADNTITLIDHGRIFFRLDHFGNQMVEEYREARREHGKSIPIVVNLSGRHRSALLTLKANLRTGGRKALMNLGVLPEDIDRMVQRVNWMLDSAETGGGYIPMAVDTKNYDYRPVDA